MKTWITGTTIGACAALTSVALAGDNPVDDLANFNLVLTPPSYSGCGDPTFDFIENSECSELITAARDGSSFLWVALSREGGFTGGGVGGAQFGLQHSGFTALGWTLCTGGSEIPESGWPASGLGNAVTWADGCYTPSGSVARIGFLSIDDGDTGTCSVTVDPRVGDATWADCQATLASFCSDNMAAVVLGDGIAPVCGDHCGEVPTQEHSWGGIKSLYR
jgi:hypothetical protein